MQEQLCLCRLKSQIKKIADIWLVADKKMTGLNIATSSFSPVSSIQSTIFTSYISKKGNILVASLCVSVCSLQAEPLDLQTQHLAHTLRAIICLKVKVVGQGHWCQDQRSQLSVTGLGFPPPIDSRSLKGGSKHWRFHFVPTKAVLCHQDGSMWSAVEVFYFQ